MKCNEFIRFEFCNILQVLSIANKKNFVICHVNGTSISELLFWELSKLQQEKFVAKQMLGQQRLLFRVFHWKIKIYRNCFFRIRY